MTGGVLLVCVAACAGVAAPPAPPRQTSLELEVSSGTLPNELRVVLVRDPRATDIQVTMKYRAGAIDDPPGQEGLAHLVEHLMFQQILGEQSLFAKLEASTSYFNAATSFDTTTFEARAARGRLDELLTIEAVRLGFRCTSITDSAFEREREVVINELRQRDFSEVYTAVEKHVYPEQHPYRRSIGGNADTVGAVTRAQACAFADAHYAPRNAVLVVSGNLSGAELSAALRKFMARVATRSVPATPAVPSVPARRREATLSTSLSQEGLVVGWPLPADPVQRTRMRAIAAWLRRLVEGELWGRATLFELGDESAPVLALFIAPGDDESLDDVHAGVKRGVEALPRAFGHSFDSELDTLAFDALQQSAIHHLFATYEDGGSRDARLAEHVLDGRDPARALADEVRALRTMTRLDGAELARALFALERATVIELVPHVQQRTGDAAELRRPVHDVGQRRADPDPAEAARPYEVAIPSLNGVVQRRLPNGLDIVLLPLTSVPTVDARLVIRAGTADEPASKRGIAVVAAHALSWDVRYINDALAFAQGGGEAAIDVGTDRTVFSVRGLDMHIDYLLAALRRWVIDGRYAEAADTVLASLRSAAHDLDDDGALTDSWRAALYGPDHPYTRAGVFRHISSALSADDLALFRRTRYTPASATLVIAGKFDAELAARWIDYLFTSWTGGTSDRTGARVVMQPSSFAMDSQDAQVQLRIALPADGVPRAHGLLIAEMLSEVVGDVRHQLGASYGFRAELDEKRLASSYVIAGAVDAARTAEAISILRDRLGEIQRDPTGAAGSFVRARKRVVARLLGLVGQATTLAERVTADIELGRPPLTDRETAHEVAALTLGEIAPSLSKLDISTAAMLMRGPAAHVDAAFAIVGRTPTRVTTHAGAQAAGPSKEERERIAEELARTIAARRAADADLSAEDIADALTQQGPSTRWRLSVMPGYATAKTLAHGVTGVTVAAALGYRYNRAVTLGARVSAGKLDGTYDIGLYGLALRPIEIIPLSAGLFLHSDGERRIWGGAFAGLYLDRLHDNDVPVEWYSSIGFGLEGGVDIVKIGVHRVGVFGRIDAELPMGAEYAAGSIGIAYRR